MAKTQFVNGDVLPAALVNGIYGADAAGGHRHDGADNDGHCPKVVLTGGAEVDGVLPAAYVDPAILISIGELDERLDTAEPIIADHENRLDTLEGSNGSFTFRFPDTQFTAQQDVTVPYRIIAGSGLIPSVVEIYLPDFSATSNGPAFSSSILLPSAIRPGAALLVPVILIDNGVLVAGAFWADSAGSGVFLTDDPLSGGGFTASGTKGFSASVVRYQLST
jgi:hypothetical protein